MCDRTAVCRIESGPEVNSCSSRSETSYSLFGPSVRLDDQVDNVMNGQILAFYIREGLDETYVSSPRDLVRRSLRRR